jgi:hypothetical protein
MMCGAVAGAQAATAVGIASTPGQGYWLAGSDGGVLSYGDAGFFGSMGGKALAAPIVGIAATPSGRGYWLAGGDGGVFAFGDAPVAGAMSGTTLNAPIVGIAATPSGRGYWLAAGDGGVFAFGDAPFAGSLGGKRLNAPIVGIAPTPSGRGYWLAGGDGGVFGFGDAQFLGSLSNKTLDARFVGIAATPSGGGYWLAGGDGGVFTFGNARFSGSLGAMRLNAPAVGIARTASGGGYRLVAGDGGVFTFGDAVFAGSPVQRLPTPVLAPPGTPGNVTVLRGGMDPARPALQPPLVDYLRRMAAAAGREIVVSTGTKHARLAEGGRVSDHWTGNAADLGMKANRGTDDGPVGDLLMTTCLTVGGVDPATAASRAATGGLFTIYPPGLRVQCIWKTYAGGNHHDHVHVGVASRRAARSSAGGVPRSPRAVGRAASLARSSATSQPRICPDLVFRAHSDDLFYDIRTRAISCRSVRRVLRRYRSRGTRCIPGWRCTYGVETAWAVEPRIRLARRAQRVYFGVGG